MEDFGSVKKEHMMNPYIYLFIVYPEEIIKCMHDY
jgi:hypothetical protein